MPGFQDAVRRLRIVQEYTTQGAEQATRKARDFAAANRDVVGTTVSVEKATLNAERSIQRLVVQGLSVMQQGAGLAQAHLGDLQQTLLGIGAGWVGYVAVAAGIGIIVDRARAAIEAYQKFEEQQTTLQNMLQATGRSSGQTAEGIEAIARTLGDLNAGREAAQELLKFREISGKVFEDTLRLAKDLSASGFGTLSSSAQMLARAMQDPVAGLKSFEQAGMTFDSSLSLVIRNLVETGEKASAAQRLTDALRNNVGGAGARSDATLSGAFRALSDELQRGSEQFGAAVAATLNLAAAVNALATALRAVNDFQLDPSVEKVLRLALRGSGAVGAGLSLLVPGAAKNDNKLASDLGINDIDSSVAAIQRQEKARLELYDSIQRETDAIGKNALWLEIEKTARENGIKAGTEEYGTLAMLIAQKHEQQKAVEDAAAAEQEAVRAREQAARQAEREAEFMRRTGEQRQTTIERLQQETQALFMSEQAARAAALAQAELAKYRERGVSVGPDQQAEIDAWARQVAQIEQLNRAISSVKNSISDFASSFAQDMFRGVSATEALANAVQRLATQLIDMAVRRLVAEALGALIGPAPAASGGFLSSLFGSEHGNVFQSGNPIQFAMGGVVSQPTIFPMASGMGLMGEAGPEAIMPLRRGPNGRLGVEAAGVAVLRDDESVLTPGQMRQLAPVGSGGGGMTFAPTINVSMPPGGKPEDGARFGKEISKVIRAEVMDVLVRQKRAGGMLS